MRLLCIEGCKALSRLVLPGESWAPRSADTGLQAHRRDKLQEETARPTNTRDNQMVKGKCKNPINRNQGCLVTSEPSSPTSASPGYLNTPQKIGKYTNISNKILYHQNPVFLPQQDMVTITHLKSKILN